MPSPNCFRTTLLAISLIASVLITAHLYTMSSGELQTGCRRTSCLVAQSTPVPRSAKPTIDGPEPASTEENRPDNQTPDSTSEMASGNRRVLPSSVDDMSDDNSTITEEDNTSKSDASTDDGRWTSRHSAVIRYVYEPAIDCNKERTYVVYVYSARSQSDRRHLIRNTWGRMEQYRNLTVNVQLFFVIGANDDDVSMPEVSSDPEVELEEEVKRYRDILICDIVDSYRNLTLKGLAALKWINSTCDRNNLEFIFKTDDDVYVQLWTIIDLAKNVTEMGCHFVGLLAKNHIVQRSGKWAVAMDEYADYKYPTYCVGGGYGITRKGFLVLIESIDRVPHFPIEDAYFTSLAIRWANPDANFTYCDFFGLNADMFLTRSKIKRMINESLNNFLLGHPVPTDLWLSLHNAVEGLPSTG